MSDEPDVDAIRRAYRNLTEALLVSAFKGRQDVAAKFYTLSAAKQAEIEAEVRQRAELIAEAMCRKLRDRGLLQNDASSQLIARLYKETLREFDSL